MVLMSSLTRSLEIDMTWTITHESHEAERLRAVSP
jgi:hypothetical protein